MVDKKDQIILGVKRVYLFGENNRDHFQGFRPADEIDYEVRTLQNYEWKRRGDLEDDASMKHPIPYCVIVNPRLKMVFAYQRAGGHTEGRLAGKYSWGIGGHVEKLDEKGVHNPIKMSMRRELQEEADIEVNGKSKNVARVLGYINDDTPSQEPGKIAVGQVHLGILYIIETDAEIITPKDAEIANGRLMTIGELEAICADPTMEVESWSQIAFDPVKRFLESYRKAA